MNFIKSLFRPSITGILASFQKKVNQLEDLVAYNHDKMQDNEDLIRSTTARNGVLYIESQRAMNAADKLREIIG